MFVRVLRIYEPFTAVLMSVINMPISWPCIFWKNELKIFFFREEINRAYKKLAVILHPDKNVAPGSEEAFKILVNARTALLHNKWRVDMCQTKWWSLRLCVAFFLLFFSPCKTKLLHSLYNIFYNYLKHCSIFVFKVLFCVCVRGSLCGAVSVLWSLKHIDGC